MKKSLKNLLSTSIYFLLVLLFAFGMVTYIGQRIEVIGSSMWPTLEDGDNLFVEKFSYKFGKPKRFDIVVFPYKYEEKTNFIKRVIGLPGETVFIDDEGRIYINGEVIEEGYGVEIIKDPGRAYEEITLADDEYFVLGDNRNNSMDSRDPNVGNIKFEDISGRVFMRVYPFKKLCMIKHQ